MVDGVGDAGRGLDTQERAKRAGAPAGLFLGLSGGGVGGVPGHNAAREILRWKKTLNAIISKHSGKTPEEVEKDSDRDYYMSAQEAKAYGLVDHVVASTREAAQSLGVVAA